MDPLDVLGFTPCSLLVVGPVLVVVLVLAYLRVRNLERRLDSLESRLSRPVGKEDAERAASVATAARERSPAASSASSVPGSSAPVAPVLRGEAASASIADPLRAHPIAAPGTTEVSPATRNVSEPGSAPSAAAAPFAGAAPERPASSPLPGAGLPTSNPPPLPSPAPSARTSSAHAETTGWSSSSDTASPGEARREHADVSTAYAPLADARPTAPSSRASAPGTRGSAARTTEGSSFERWLGVRGAAVVGGIFLALAGILFFQYSIEHGWITPALRVALGIALGLASFAASEILLRRGYRSTASAIAGAGAVILYAASWAAYSLFGLWPFALSFGVMACVTVACCLLALRHSSQVVATLGLVGGLATPLLLSTGADRPIGLFGYLLLLDAGFLAVATRRRWPAIGLVGLLGTFVIQALWIVDRMQPETFAIGLVVLGAFAALFALAAGSTGREERARWALAQTGALLLPFAFALHFARHVDFGVHLWPLVALAALLSAGACFTAKRQPMPLVPLAAAAGSAAIVWIWLASKAPDPARAPELVACCLGLAAVFHLFCEWRRPRDATAADGVIRAALVATFLLLIALIAGAGRSPTAGPWFWIASELALVVLVYRQAALSGRDWLQVLAVVVLGLGLAMWPEVRDWRLVDTSQQSWIVLLLVVSAVLQVLVLARRAPDGRRWAGWAACVFHLPAMFFLASGFERGPPLVVLAGLLALGVASSSAATIARSGVWFGVGVVLACVLTDLGSGAFAELGFAGDLPLALALLAFAALVLSAWPVLARARFAHDAWAFRAGALVGVCLLAAFEDALFTGWGRSAIVVLPLSLAVLDALLARRLQVAEIGAAGTEPAQCLRLGAIAYTAAALFHVSLALPLHLDRGVLRVTLALFGAALIALWRRRDHPPLKYAGVALIAATTLGGLYVRTFERYATYDGQLVNWLLYDFLLPAAAAIAAAIWLAPLEVARLRTSERRVYATEHALGAGVLMLCAVVLVFAWLNLAIRTWFGEEPRFAFDAQREPARDLTVSIAWALYALVLLGLGVRGKLAVLRWASLLLLVATIGKVFLFDLGNLAGLYRVASLAGLAVSLLLVSLLYQRFVFRRVPGAAAEA